MPICPYCQNDDASLMELVAYWMSGGQHPDDPIAEKQERYVCGVCSREFVYGPSETV